MPLFAKQIPADLIVVLFLRPDIEDHVGHGQQFFELDAVGRLVAIEVGRVDEHLVFQFGSVVSYEPAIPQCGVKPFGPKRAVVIDDGSRVVGRVKDDKAILSPAKALSSEDLPTPVPPMNITTKCGRSTSRSSAFAACRRRYPPSWHEQLV